MNPALPQRDREEILSLMAAVDAAFGEGDFILGEELDARLEQRLEDLDHRLSDLDEAGDVLDGDNHVGIEDQFIATWSQVLSGIGCFAPTPWKATSTSSRQGSSPPCSSTTRQATSKATMISDTMRVWWRNTERRSASTLLYFEHLCAALPQGIDEGFGATGVPVELNG